MSQKFNINVWKTYYNRIDAIGKIVKKNIHDKVNTGICDLTKYEINKMISQADEIMKECVTYMDSHGVSRRLPLWKYEPNDETTWASSPQFKYAHLVKDKK